MFIKHLYILLIGPLISGCAGTGNPLKHVFAKMLSVKTPEESVANPFDLPDTSLRPLQEKYYNNLIFMVKKLDKTFKEAHADWIGFKLEKQDTVLTFILKSSSRYSSSTLDKKKRQKQEIKHVISPFVEKIKPLLKNEIENIKGLRIISKYKYKNYLRQNDKLKHEVLDFFMPIR
ncbi:MAG: hypothetical protein ABIA63_01070 [bacterium]